MKPDFEKGNGLLPTVGFGLVLAKNYGTRAARVAMCSMW